MWWMERSAASPMLTNRERLGRLEQMLARLTPLGAALAPARIWEWRGEAFSGYFVRLDASTFALHVGDGHYVWLDLERDLAGQLTSEAIRQLRPRA
jgi:hypothetical protein